MQRSRRIIGLERSIDRIHIGLTDDLGVLFRQPWLDNLGTPTGTFPQSGGPLTIPAEFQLKVHYKGEVFAIPTINTPAAPVQPITVSGSTTLAYLCCSTNYALAYQVSGNLLNNTLAFFVGVGAAIAAFVTTLFTLVVSYFRANIANFAQLFGGQNRFDDN